VRGTWVDVVTMIGGLCLGVMAGLGRLWLGWCVVWVVVMFAGRVLAFKRGWRC